MTRVCLMFEWLEAAHSHSSAGLIILGGFNSLFMSIEVILKASIAHF